jgi:peptidoglycan hydrolase CwlO-like protein
VALAFLIATITPSTLAADKATKSAEQQNVQIDINGLNVQLVDAVAKYEQAAVELDELNAKIDLNQRDLQTKVHELVVATDILDKRAVGIYKRGSVSYLEVIFNSKDLWDFLQQFDLLLRIGERDSEIVGEVNKQKKVVEAKAKELEVQHIEQESRTNDLAFQRETIETQLADKTNVLASIIQEIAALDAAEAERVAKAKAAQGGRRTGAKLNYVLANLDSCWSTGSGPLGPGERSDHGPAGHGVWLGGDAFDLDDPAGTVVYAAHGGTVKSIGYERYGVTRIEGDGFLTLYAHVEPLLYPGQFVSPGDIVGTVAYGHDGWYQHLHFELIDNGEAVPAGDYRSYF